MKNFCEDLFFGDRLKNFCEDLFFFFLESTCALCSRSLALASSILVLGLESVCPRKSCPWPWPWPRIFFVSLALALASSLVSSTPPLVTALLFINLLKPRDSESIFRFLSQAATCRLRTVFFTAKRHAAGKQGIPIFIVFGLTDAITGIYRFSK